MKKLSETQELKASAVKGAKIRMEGDEGPNDLKNQEITENFMTCCVIKASELGSDTNIDTAP